MSVIYKIKNPEDSKDILLVSKDYVDSQFKALKDALINHERNIDNAHTKNSGTSESAANLDNTEFHDLNIESIVEQTEILASKIKTDSTHRFLTDSQIISLRDKPSDHEVDNAISKAKEDIKRQYMNLYTKFLNIPDGAKKLREIANIISSDNNLSNLVGLLNDKISVDELEDHENDASKHINNNDRKALNVLLNLINTGLINTVENLNAGVINTSMNSHALDNKSYEQVRDKSIYTKTIGIFSSGYDETRADVMLPAGQWLSKEFFDLGLYKQTGKVAFLPGLYDIPEMNIYVFNDTPGVIIEGSGESTEFLLNRGSLNNITIRDMLFKGKDSGLGVVTIFLGSKVVLENMTLRNITFEMESSERCIIRNCILDHCTFRLKAGSCYNNIFMNNIVDDYSVIPKYNGGGNQYINNIKLM